ncbi:tetratricopeptide repeat protein [Thalassotalea piscium]
MSVINQMLKDLDKRQQDTSPHGSANPSAVVVNKSKSQLWIIIVLVMLLMISLGVILWQKIMIAPNESSVVKVEPLTEPQTESPKVDHQSDKATLTSRGSNENLPSGENNRSEARIDNDTINSSIKQPRTHAQKQAQLSTVDTSNSKAEIKSTQVKVDELVKKQGVEETLTPVTPLVEKPVADIAAPTLSISRKQLTPEQLASKKIAQAEQAIANKDLKKAEQLFEDVLLILPSHKSARKQLAALWFGKQSYQAALNLLSRGLALDSQDAEFRLMKARIYLNQGQTKLALDVLKVLDTLPSIEYQSLLASTAQQVGTFSLAEKAYKILTELAPERGRWWLGLAIAQDSQSQFAKAKNNYKNALLQQDLSSETIAFAKNRIIELGE